MPDHLHLLVADKGQDAELLPFLKTFKQKSAYCFKRQTAARLWQKKYDDHIVRESDCWEAGGLVHLDESCSCGFVRSRTGLDILGFVQTRLAYAVEAFSAFMVSTVETD